MKLSLRAKRTQLLWLFRRTYRPRTPHASLSTKITKFLLLFLRFALSLSFIHPSYLSHTIFNHTSLNSLTLHIKLFACPHIIIYSILQRSQFYPENAQSIFFSARFEYILYLIHSWPPQR